MELFRRTLAGLLMLVAAVSVGIWVQGRFIDAVRLPTHTRMIGATYTTLSDPFYETINDEIQMQIKSNGDLLLVRDPGQDQERQNQEIEDMLNKGIELLIVNPVDYVGVTPALEKAREKGAGPGFSGGYLSKPPPEGGAADAMSDREALPDTGIRSFPRGHTEREPVQKRR